MFIVESVARSRPPGLVAGYAACFLGSVLQIAAMLLVVLHMALLDGSSDWAATLLTKTPGGPGYLQFLVSALRFGVFCLLAAWLVGRWRRRAWRRAPRRHSTMVPPLVPASAGASDRDASARQLADSYARRVGRGLASPLSPEATRAAARIAAGGALPIVQVVRTQPEPDFIPASESGGKPRPATEPPFEEADLTCWRSGRPMAMLCVSSAALFIVFVGAAGVLLEALAPAAPSKLADRLGFFFVWTLPAFSATIPPLGLAPFRLSSCIARPGGVSSSGWFRRIEFTPADTLLLIEGRWHGLTLITFIRADGAWKRLTVDQSGLDHLLGCWRSLEPAPAPQPLSTAWAAARRAIGTRNGEQET